MKRLLLVATMATAMSSMLGCGCFDRVFRRGATTQECMPTCAPCMPTCNSCDSCGGGCAGGCAAGVPAMTVPETYAPAPVPVPVR